MPIWTAKRCATSSRRSDAVRSIRDIQDRIAELARGKQPGEWIVTMPIGDPPYYFDVPDILAEKRWPTRQELDAAAPNNPVYIRSIWGFWRGDLSAGLLRQHRGAQARRHHARHRFAGRHAHHREGRQRRPDRRVHRARIPADRRADLVPRRDPLLARRSRARAAAVGAPVPRLRHHQRVRGPRHRDRGAGRLQGSPPRRRADDARDARDQPELEGGGGDAPVGPLLEAWAGWLGEPGARRRLAQDERAVRRDRTQPRRRRARLPPRPTPAGPASTPTRACRASSSRRCCSIARPTTSAWRGSPARRGWHCSISTRRSTARSRSRAVAGSSSTSTSCRRATSSGSSAWAWC